MQIYYFKSHKNKNFGDDLNEWIWDRLIPGWQSWDDEVTLFGVGTIINQQSTEKYRDSRLLVLGSGVGYGASLDLESMPRCWDFQSVRGPRSARLLGLPIERGIIDPAAMISEFSEYRNLEKSDAPIFVPHHESVERHDWASLCQDFGVSYVSPCGGYKDVIAEIARAPLVFAESMHAAIFAESFRVPWVPVRIGPSFNAEKWIDVFEAANLSSSIYQFFPNIDRAERMIRYVPRRRYRRRIRATYERTRLISCFEAMMRQKPILGDATALDERKSAYRTVLEDVKGRYS
ncbi:succinoglycan biosynthesis protein ExoV [Thioclava dalianensis]|uniref:polysaccharide pyruvyl transferase family protein n=1 Tax=Thioclava dalianensis TaxID=1185766 RepID=UPI0008F648AE|nr:polysaccharide pyruvyl transferase family protein [Thioclava dalianensis]SFN93907.1 succinoglycan biosynthesis protein ExoV [Thioclava dalianensis]